MTERLIGVTDVASGAGVADYRTRERSGHGVEQYLIPLADRVPSFKGIVASFRVPGVAAANTPYFSIFNKTGSGVLVAVRELLVAHEFPAATGTMRTNSITRVTTAPTGGTLHTPTALDTGLSHNANVEVRGAASADGTASAITSTVGATIAWRNMVNKDPDQTGQMLFLDIRLVPIMDEASILREGEGFRVGQTETGNANSGFLYRAVIEEYTT